MNDLKTLGSEILRITKRLTEIDGRYRAFQTEREGWLQKPNSPEKLSKLDELDGNLRIVNGDSSVLRNILKDLQIEKDQKDKEDKQRELEGKIEVMRGVKKKLLAERDTRQKIVTKAREIIKQAEAEHEKVFETLFEINSEFRGFQRQFLVQKFGSSGNIPKNRENELVAELISQSDLGWLR